LQKGWILCLTKVKEEAGWVDRFRQDRAEAVSARNAVIKRLTSPVSLAIKGRVLNVVLP
jgi:hypothetical protein